MAIISTTRTATADEIAHEMDRRGAVIEILEAEFEREKLRADTFERQYRQACSDLAQAVGQRDTYRDACKSTGICMTCVLGAPDTFGCTDCLDTGWDGGAPAGFAPDAEITRLRAEVARKDEALKPFAFERSALDLSRYDDENQIEVRYPPVGRHHRIPVGHFTVGDLRRARAERMPEEGCAALEQEGA